MSNTLLTQNTEISSVDLNLICSVRERLILRNQALISEKQRLDPVSSLFYGNTESAVLLPRLTCSLPLLYHQIKHTVKHSETGQSNKTLLNWHPVERREVACLINYYRLHAAIKNIEHLWRGTHLCLSLDTQIHLNHRFRIWFVTSNVQKWGVNFSDRYYLLKKKKKSLSGREETIHTLNISVLLKILDLSKWLTTFQQQGNGDWELICENRWSLILLWKNLSAPLEDQVVYIKVTKENMLVLKCWLCNFLKNHVTWRAGNIVYELPRGDWRVS